MLHANCKLTSGRHHHENPTFIPLHKFFCVQSTMSQRATVCEADGADEASPISQRTDQYFLIFVETIIYKSVYLGSTRWPSLLNQENLKNTISSCLGFQNNTAVSRQVHGTIVLYSQDDVQSLKFVSDKSSQERKGLTRFCWGTSSTTVDCSSNEVMVTFGETWGMSPPSRRILDSR